MPALRAVFYEEINAIDEQIVSLAEQVEHAMRAATKALLAPDAELAAAVIDGDRLIDERRWSIESSDIDLIARQQPVASDLRRLVSALRVVGELERMGDLACHIAAVARMRFPEPAAPPPLHDLIAEMGRVADTMSLGMRELLAGPKLVTTADLEADDDAMDRLHREMFTRLLTCQPPVPVEAAIDATLLSRYYERFADHAVTVSGHVLFVVTGDGRAGPPIEPSAAMPA
jgi:phosphate transport system protein